MLGAHDCQPAQPDAVRRLRDQGFLEYAHVPAGLEALADARRAVAEAQGYERVLVTRDRAGGSIVLVRPPDAR